MIDDGILNGDIIVCKQSQIAEKGQTIIAVVDGEATVKKYHPLNNSVELIPANANYKPIKVNPYESEFKIVGLPVGLFRQYPS